MKIVIISDIHREIENADKALGRHPDAEYLLFLGDGERDFSELSRMYPRVGFIGVAGNCDITLFSDDKLPYERVNELGGVKIYMTHGHRTGTTDTALGVVASKYGASVALYGHTHIPYIGEYISSNGEKITVFNPGSIGRPRGCSAESYGVMEIINGRFTLKHYEL